MIKPLFQQAHLKLSLLGKALFYCYIAIILACCVAMVYGGIEIAVNLAHFHQQSTTPIWQSLLLMVVSYFIAKQLLRESLNLVDIKLTLKPNEKDTIEEDLPEVSNVISFFKKTP